MALTSHMALTLTQQHPPRDLPSSTPYFRFGYPFQYMFQGAEKCAEFVQAQFPVNVLHFSLGFPSTSSGMEFGTFFDTPKHTFGMEFGTQFGTRVETPYPRNVGKFYEPFILKKSASFSGPRMANFGKFLGPLCFQIRDMFRSLEWSIQQIFSGPMT